MKKILYALICIVLVSVSFCLVANISPAKAASTQNNITGNLNSELDIEYDNLPGSPVTNQLKERAKSSWPWYTTRASGLMAATLLVLLLLSGMGFITGHSFKFLEPISAWATHRAMGIALGAMVLIHIVSLLFDKFLPFSLVQILMPFASKYRPVSLFGIKLGTLYVALGVVAFYLLVAVVISSLLWIDKKSRLWKLIHFLNYLVITFIFVHALTLGTDLAHGILRWIWIASAVLVAVFIVLRLRRARTA